jgi:hypothetical protein
MGRRAAVVIGVDRPKQLTPLQSAADGAARVEAWLKGEGFDVICLTDKAAPVQADDVKKAIKTYVTNPPRYSMLVVYFSGHGYWSRLGDVWLLSHAPEDTGEAINVGGAMLLAGYSGIPNVVFISDACRSAADTRSGILVEGVAAFPNYGDIEQPSKVDCFRATTASLSAYEGQISGSPQSVLTAAWMAAYQDPEPSMVRSLDVGNTKIWVVPNRRLEEYLQRKVDDLLAAIDPNLSQRIEASVPSSDEIYIARAQRVPQLAAPLPPPRGRRCRAASGASPPSHRRPLLCRSRRDRPRAVSRAAQARRELPRRTPAATRPRRSSVRCQTDRSPAAQAMNCCRPIPAPRIRCESVCRTETAITSKPKRASSSAVSVCSTR